jgi:eukaryotic translation initiation factor 2-alpha kinase 4
MLELSVLLVKQVVFGHISSELWLDIAEILQQPKSSASQKRAQLLAKGLLRSTLDEVEALTDNG